MEVAIMDGILEKFMRDAAQNPERPMYTLWIAEASPMFITI